LVSALLLIPATVVYGAAIALATASVAILSYLTILGVTLPVVDDHGELFALAAVVLACSAAVLVCW
jgi:hypothetical protein